MLLVKDIMTKPVIVIRSSATVENAIWLMRTKRVRSLIVEESYETSLALDSAISRLHKCTKVFA